MRKSTVLKVVATALGLVVVLVFIAAAYVATNVDRYKGLVVTKIEQATGRDVEVETVHLVPALTPTVAAAGVRFANAAWGSEPHMVTAKRIEAKIALFPLVAGNVIVEEFVLIEPDILLETDAQGHGNWRLGAEAGEPLEQRPGQAAAGQLRAVGVQQIDIRQGRLRYRDGVTDRTTTLVVDRLAATADDTYSALAVKTGGEYNGTRIDVDATLGALRTLLANEPFPIDVTLNAADARATIKGTLDRPMEIQGLGLDLAMQAESLEALSRLAATELPPMGPLAISGRLSDSKTGYQVDGLEAKLGNSDVSGTIDAVLTGERPKVSAQLTSRNIDLAYFTGARATRRPDADGQPDAASADAKTGKKAARVFPADPLPVSALRALDADVSLRTERLVTPQLPMENVELKVALEAGRLTLKPAKAQMAGGAVGADLVVDARPQAARVTAKVTARQIDIDRLLRGVEGADVMIGGKTDITLDLAGQGSSVQALAAGLNGKVLIVTGEGRIRNKFVNMAGGGLTLEILGMLNPFTQQDEYTTVQCAVVRCDIKDGIATSDNAIALETDKVQILGTGTINLKTEELNLLIQSQGREGVVLGAVKSTTRVGGVSLAGLVQVGGTLAAPKLQLNPEGIVKQGLSLTAAVATAGLSVLVENLLKQATQQEGPCVIAQGGATPDTGSVGWDAPPEPAVEKETEPKKGGVGGFLKGILGE